MDYYKMTVNDILNHFDTNIKKGVTPEKRKAYTDKYGFNVLPEEKSPGFIIRFLSQFRDFMIVILLISAFISGYISYMQKENDFTEPIIILAIVIINALFGSLQELKAEKSIKALKSCQARQCQVMVNGARMLLDTRLLIPGDIIFVAPGDIIPGDARLISTTGLNIDESCLTGESKNIIKDENRVYKQDTPLFERRNMIYSSTLVTSGFGCAIVTATGKDTEVGHIASMLRREAAPPSPLFLRVKKLSKVLGSCCLGICFIVFILGLFNHTGPLEMFVTSLSLAVAAIPEGLPAATTIMLSIGVTRLAKERAILKNLSGVETLGKITVICSDKTGTITKNNMTVVGFETDCKYHEADREAYKNESYKTLLSNALLCSSAEDNNGNATEKAIYAAYHSAFGNWACSADRKYEIPFNSNRKTMVTLYQNKNTINIYVKGAFDKIISRTSLSLDDRHSLEQIHNSVCGQGLRVIAVASRSVDTPEFTELIGCGPDMIKSVPAGVIYEKLVNSLDYNGFISITDPPREEVYDAIKIAKNAGIKTTMITGDHLVTAKAIGKMVGIPAEKCITGNDLSNMSIDVLREKIKDCSIFARVTPEDKLKLIKAYQENGERVVMTGDGINDAPALKAADIGAAMGKSGTDVARESSDLILTDDNYNTIINAIKGGRGIFENIKKSLHFLLSCNSGEIFTVLLPLLFSLATPLAATQLLAINLITDSLPAIALGMETCGAEVMNSSWIKNNEKTFSPLKIFTIVFEGMLIASLSLIGYLCYGSTGCFTVLGLTEIFHSFNLRDEKSIFKRKTINPYILGSGILCTSLLLGAIYIKGMRKAFSLTLLSPAALATLFAISSVIIIVKEIEKKLFA